MLTTGSFTVLLLYLAIASICQTTAANDDPGPTPLPMKTASLNKYLDAIFNNLDNDATSVNIDPLILPNISKPLKSKWYFPYDYLILTDGSLDNLKNIKIHGDSTISYFNDTMEMKIDVALKNLKVQYDFVAGSHNSWFALQGILHGSVGQTQVFLDLTVDARTLAIRAKKITFPGLKKLDFSIRSTILATWVVNAILEVAKLLSGFIMGDIEDAITNAFNSYVENHIPHVITYEMSLT